MAQQPYVNRTFATRLNHPLQNVSPTAPLPTGAFPNPFGNSVQFSQVAYEDQISQMPPPTVMVENRFPSVSEVAGNGITIELWFKAESSGSLVNLPMGTDPANPTAIAPLIYIDSNGMLRAGLFDSTQITLLTPPQNLIASQNADGLVTVGPVNILASPLSVVDGQWHHAALVVMTAAQSSTAQATQNLYLDGRLAATCTGNGNFGLSFVASDGTTWTGNTDTANIPLGGPISPMPASPPPSYNYLPYAQGFCGCLNEFRIWNGPRIIPSIQSLMDQPVSSNLGLYESEGLVGYVGSAQLAQAVQPTAYLALTADAPPFDPFAGIDRIQGYQNFGIYTAIPFTTANAPLINFQPNQTYSTKITLCQADQLQVSFPGTDSNDDGLKGTFSMMVTGASGGHLSNLSQLKANTTYTFNAPAQDCYRLDFTYSQTASINRLQFMLVPGPLNTLMQLLLDVVPLQTAYTDPDYPIAPTPNVPDPRYPPGSGKTVTLPAYWPPFTDETVFPIDPTQWDADDLLRAYLNFNQAAQAQQSTFSEFFNLSTNSAPISDVSEISALLDKAYFAIVGTWPSPPIPGQAPATSIDQVYAFIYNVNAMRTTLFQFLTAYQGWAQNIINAENLNLNATPGAIANNIYNAQNNIDATLKGPSTGDFIANLLLGSAIIGLGAVCPLAVPALLAGAAAATITATTVAVTAIGGAGANMLSELLGSFLGSSSANLKPIPYNTLEDVANNVSLAISSAYTTLLGNVITPTYLQTLYSNYGLLLALGGVNPQPLAEANQATLLDPNNSLVTGTTMASWKALIPSVFTWSPVLLTGKNLSSNTMVFMVTQGSADNPPYQSKPSELGIQTVLQNDPWKAFYWMLSNVQNWQTGADSAPWDGQFFTICPIYFMWSSGASGDQETTADWVISWSLIDADNNDISPKLLPELFGVGSSNTPLALADQNNPFAAAGYGWYCDIATPAGAVTTPFDAYMNWGEGVPSYSTQILAAQTFAGTLFDATYKGFDVQFAAAAASDTPPPALVTLKPDVLNFGSSPVGQEASIQVVLTNNQQNSLQFTSSSSDINFATSKTLPELPSGASANFSVAFIPQTAGELSGTITFTAQGQYGPVTLTLKCTGTGVETSQSVDDTKARRAQSS